MDHVLAIYDAQKKYAKRLAALFERHGQLPFHIMAFDNAAKLENFFREKQASVLLINETDWQESMRKLADQTILLTGGKEKECLESERGELLPAVCKYQSGEAIAKKVLGICAASDTPALTLPLGGVKSTAKAEVIGVYTPVGRSLQTSFALVYSRLSAARKKTLYLNFEVFSGFGKWFEREYQTDLMDLMYFLDEPEQKFLLKLAGMTEEFAGFYYIPPAISYEDFMLVKGSEWMRLIQTIAEKGDYERIVLDLGDQMQGLIGILSLCEKVYTICKPDGVAMAKVACFEEALKMSQKEEILHKMVKCSLPVFKELPQSAEKLSYSQLAQYMKNRLGEAF